MKQHITGFQLNELEDEAYNTLLANIYGEDDLFSEIDEEDVDINILITYLNNSSEVHGFHLFHIKRDTGIEWGLEMKTEASVNSYRAEELIDVLWSAMKDIL